MPQDSINEFIIRMLNSLVVVDFRFICIPVCVMHSEVMVFTVTSSNCKVKIARFYEFLFTLGEDE